MAFLFSPGCGCCQTDAPSGPSGTCYLCGLLVSLPSSFIIVNLSGWSFTPLNDDHQLDAVSSANDPLFHMQWAKTFCSLGVLDPDCFDAGEPFPQYNYLIRFYIKFARSIVGVACPNTIRHRCYLEVSLTYHEDASTVCSWTCTFVLRNGSWVLHDSTNSGEDCGLVDPEAQPACGTFTFYPPGECIYQWLSGAWVNIVGVISTPEEICGDPDCSVECTPPLEDGTEEGEYGQGTAECDCPCVCTANWQWSAPDPEHPESGSWVYQGSDPVLCCNDIFGDYEPSEPGTFDGEMTTTCCD